MNEEQLQQLIQQLAEVQDANTIVQYMQQLGDQAVPLIELITQRAQQGDATAQQAVENIQQAIQSVSQMAKFGAKLNYIRSLRGQCPDGYEMQYFKQGGPMGTRLCKQCVAKQKKMEESGKAPSNLIDAFKCGRKMSKKKIKKARGGADSDTFKDTGNSTIRTTKKGNMTREIRYRNNPNSWGNDTTYVVDTGIGLPLRFSNMFNTDYGTDRRGYTQAESAFNEELTPTNSKIDQKPSKLTPQEQTIFQNFINKHSISRPF